MKYYYINFKPEANINYLHLFSIYDLAEYNTNTKAFDTINYSSIPKLAEMLPFSASTLNRILTDDKYQDFISIDKENKTITINNSFVKGSQNKCFVRLSDNEIDFLRNEKDNLLCKYYIYIKYYCSLAEKLGIQQDFTAKQFLTAIGYSTKSNSQIDKLSTYNNKLKEEGLISITTYRDDLGHTRNCYKTKQQK